MGFFDLPSPLFSLVSRFLVPFLPETGIITIGACFASCFSMAVYLLLSPQKRLAVLKQHIVDTRMNIAGHHEEFGSVVKLGAQLLSLTLKQVLMTSGPAVAAALPVIFIYVWMSNTFTLDLPDNGMVKVSLFPQNCAARLVTELGRPQKNGTWFVPWHSLGSHLQIVDGIGQTVVNSDTNAYVSILHKRKWWNLFLGNPAGYIENSSTLERVEFDFKRLEYFCFGPSWLRGWKGLFLGVTFSLSFAVKSFFKIH